MSGGSSVGNWVDRDALFVSYSRDDARWMQAFRVMLNPMLDDVGVRLWIDTDIRTGDDWRSEIEQAIARSGVALLLVSSRFLYSEYIREYELPALLRHRVVFAPVLVGSCGWGRRVELEAVQWLHDPGREGPLDLVADQPGERDRRIWQACERLLSLCPERKAAVSHSPPAANEVGGPVADVPVDTRAGRLFGVPELPPVYVAREEELSALVELLTESSTGAVGVTGDASIGLHGQGGIGKTVLAAAMAHDNAVRCRFPDGIYWVTVGQVGDVVGAQLDLLRQVDPSVAAPSTASEVERTLRAAFGGLRTLLIVDDVWSDADAHAFRLTGARGRVLYTSRDARVLASVGAHAYPVEVLSRDAARLFASTVLHGTRPAAQYPLLPDAADRAIEQVGRIALAVGLLAAAVRSGRKWLDVAADLDSAADVFGDHPYANTFKAMQVGVTTLPADLREALLSLAVLPPDSRTPRTTVTQYWRHARGYTPAATESVLQRLSAATLLSFNGDHIEFHDLQHEYLLLHAPGLAKLHGELLAAYRLLLPDGRDWSRLPADEPYIWNRLIYHLRGAGARRELGITVTQPAFLAHRLTAGLPVAENDLADAARALPADGIISWWRAWLPRHADVLTPPASATTVHERLEAVTPSMLAWLDADPSRPASVDPQVLRRLCPNPFLAVIAGLEPRPAQQLRTLPGHSGGVTAIAWSPNRAVLATASRFGPVRVWDPSSGHATALPDTRGAHVLAWSPDSTRLATTSSSRSHSEQPVRVWDPISGHTTTLPDTRGAIVLAWSPDSTRLATASSYSEQPVRVWDPISARTITVPDTHGAYVLAWSPDSTRLAIASGSYREQPVRVWDPISAHTTTLHDTHRADVLAWSPDSTRLATTASGSYREQPVRVWDPISGHTTTLPDTHDAIVLAWSPDSTRLATASGSIYREQPVRVWDPISGHTTTLPDTSSADVLAWSPDSTRLATTASSYNGIDPVRVWDPISGHATITLPDTHAADVLAWSPDSTRLATTSSYRPELVRVWDPSGGHTTTLPDTHRADVLAWSPDSTRLATTSNSSEEVRVWNPIVEPGPVRAVESVVAWSPDGTRLATTSRSYREQPVRMLDLSSGQATILPDTHGATMLAWSADGTRLATGSYGPEPVRVWHLSSGHTTTLYDTHGATVLAWSPDGTRLAASGYHHRPVRVWHPSSGHTTTLPDTHSTDMLAWSPDSTRLATTARSSYSEQPVRVWHPISGNITTLPDTHRADVLAWSPDSTHLAAINSAGAVLRVELSIRARSTRIVVGHVSYVGWSADRIVGLIGDRALVLELTVGDTDAPVGLPGRRA